MPKSKSLAKSPAYPSLLKAIHREMTTGVERARRAVEHQVIRTNWTIGKMVARHFESINADPAAKSKVIGQLSRDLKRPADYFYRVIRMYHIYPVLLKDPFFKWTHYKALVSIEDPDRRKKYEQLALRQNLSAKRLQSHWMLERKTALIPANDASQQLPLTRGRLYYYRAIKPRNLSIPQGRVHIDVGFAIQREVPNKTPTLASSICLYSVKTPSGYTLKITPRREKDRLYTYIARLERVVDGDTLILNIDCGFSTWFRTRLRLRGINTPELGSALGAKAKEYVRSRLAKCGFIIAKTYRPDKYGRYLADIFYLPKASDPGRVAEKGTFLNQELLDKGLANIFNGPLKG